MSKVLLDHGTYTSTPRALEAEAPPSSRYLRQVRSGVEASASNARAVGARTDFQSVALPVELPGREEASLLPAQGGDVKLALGSRAVARNYAKIHPWIDPADLEQEAILSLLSERRRKPDAGLDEAAIAARAMWCSVVVQNCPAHLPEANGRKSQAALSVVREPLETSGRVGTAERTSREHPDVAAIAVESFEPFENCIDLARAAVAIRSLLEAEPEAARAVLYDEEKPAAVAARLGIPVSTVYLQRDKAMRHLRAAFAVE